MASEMDLREYFTLSELKNRMVNNELVQITDVLNTPLQLPSDLVIGRCSSGDDDIVTRSLYEPQGDEVNYNQGHVVKIGQTEQATEHTAIIEQGWYIEKKLAKRSGNYKLALLQEEKLQANGLRKLWAQRFFHGNRATASSGGAHQINGLANRSDYNALASGTARPWVFDMAQGETPSVTANKTSIWFVKHSEEGVRWVAPQGAEDASGIRRDYFGEDGLDYTDPVDSKPRHMRIYRGMLTLAGGISIKDPRAVVVIHNISMSEWDNVNDFDIIPGVLIDAMNYMNACTQEIPGNVVCYMHHRLRARVWRMQHDLTLTRTMNENLKVPEWFIGEYPVHCCDEISITGSKVE